MKIRCAQLHIIIQTLECCEYGGREEGDEDGGQENDTCMNLSSDSENEIDCIPSVHIHSNGCLSVQYFTMQ